MLAKVLKALTGSGARDAVAEPIRRRGPVCVQCRAPLAAGSRRCARCGTRVLSTAPGVEPVAAKPTATPARVRSDLLEARILARALRGNSGQAAIQVLPSRGAAVGEIKVAGERIFGDEAVRAVARLVQAGDLAPLGDDGFVLTATGRRRAQSFSS